MTIQMTSWPLDARKQETERCVEPIEKSDLERLAAIANQDLVAFHQKRPELRKLRAITVLGEEGADHFIDRRGFRCLSVWTFFRKAKGIRHFHPMRHTRLDFGSAKFGHSSWIKHPGDIGFKGRGINCFGRSIEIKKNEKIDIAFKRYLAKDTSSGAKRLKKSSCVVLWPPQKLGDVIQGKSV